MKAMLDRRGNVLHNKAIRRVGSLLWGFVAAFYLLAAISILLLGTQKSRSWLYGGIFNVRAWATAVQSNASRGELSEALELAELSVALTGARSAENLHTLALVHHRLGNGAKAKEAILKAVDRQPKSRYVQDLLAEIAKSEQGQATGEYMPLGVSEEEIRNE